MSKSAGGSIKAAKYATVAEELARSGAVVIDDGLAALYFLWGQPNHAYARFDGDLVEGEPALKSIAFHLLNPCKVEWHGKEIVQLETLRCTTADVVQTLTTLAQADAESPHELRTTPDGWDGIERRESPALTYSLDDFPLLPTGPPLWADVPANVVHFDVLFGGPSSLLVTFVHEGIRAAGVILRNEFFDALCVRDKTTLLGKDAWELMMQQSDGVISAYEIDDTCAEALPMLWRHRVIYSGIDLRWLDTKQFLESIRQRGEASGVVVTTANDRCVVLFTGGQCAGAYSRSDSQPLAEVEGIVALCSEGAPGSVTVIERRDDDVAQPLAVKIPTEAPVDEEGTEVRRPETSVDVAAFFAPAPVRSEKSEESVSPPPAPRSTGPAPLLQLGQGSSAPRAKPAHPRQGPPRQLPPTDDYTIVVDELAAISDRLLGADGGTLRSMILSTEHSPAGVRATIRRVREASLPGHTPAEITAVANEMVRTVADRVTAL